MDTGDRDLPAQGLILVRASNNQVFHYGDRLRLRGQLKTPPENEDFSYRDYLAARHIHSYMTNAFVTVLPGRGGNPFLRATFAIKDRSLENIYRMFPDPESSLLAGILLGPTLFGATLFIGAATMVGVLSVVLLQTQVKEAVVYALPFSAGVTLYGPSDLAAAHPDQVWIDVWLVAKLPCMDVEGCIFVTQHQLAHERGDL